ncbi:isoleucine--tRNA ligase [Chengkuizengella axinellae]|uniref:Isoleucine--tRNA ligase n=1 Tax=Chengkuizengella axinellae TaxID=3064388 RepID=A0ABT9IV24_9BACL|nr:isoleucine--tRNA ligase [Chengkuizengella sp. 2205SS18-9]MDP5273172.1 isoleucine--tRNA ligase [Chengkuizengella sp. 2205SS18-9]
MDYGKTLNLPQTDFPMRGNLPKAEPNLQKWWEEIDIYKKLQEKQEGKPLFVLHDGPPYANGDTHIGHALNKVLKDIIVRYKTMQGYNAPYVPGWDTHGLPIEAAIAKKGKVDRKKLSISEFRDYCKDYALNWVGKQKEQFKRLGVRGDWENPYLTLLPEYEAEQIRVFGEMVKKGYIYKGLKCVYWSPSSESALAEAEIEYHDKKSPSIYVAFQVKDGKGILPEDASIVIWTTTPWTLPANLGISLHPEFDYVMVDVKGKKFVVAEGLLDSLKTELEWDSLSIIDQFKGSELEHITCAHPFYDRDSLVMLGEHVTLDAGTGCVHTAPGHGEDDFEIGAKYGLDVLCPVDDQGKFTKEAPGFEGMFYDKTNKIITEKLEASGRLLKLTFMQHQYPHDWRTKKPVIYRATEQWFASIDKFRDKMLEEIKNVKWTPEWGETRLHNMIRDRGDWCISRQRTWGVPIPIFYCKSCNHELLNDETINFVADVFAKEGSNAWFIKSENELMPEGAICPSCGHDQFKKETDIMDVWFDSGSSHQSVLAARDNLHYPADLYLEGSDQYRGWFNSSLITSVAVDGIAPYKEVLSHGFTLDGEGRKMSKSLGNTIDPIKVSNQLGAEILRLWVSSVDYQADQRISDNILKQTSEVYRKIRNTLRFFLGNLTGFNPATDKVSYDQLSELDRFALIRLNKMLDKVTNAYNRYDFNVVYQSVHHFCSVEMSAFYLDIVKDTLYVNDLNDPKRKAVQTVLYEALVVITKLIAPILPHTADEVWRFIPNVDLESVQLAEIPSVNKNVFDEKLEQKWNQFMIIREEVFKKLEEARKEKIIGNSLAAALDLYPNASTADLLKQFTKLNELFIVSAVSVHEASDQEEEIQVKVSVAEGEKCERCWMVTTDVGEDSTHPSLCRRCASIIG